MTVSFDFRSFSNLYQFLILLHDHLYHIPKGNLIMSIHALNQDKFFTFKFNNIFVFKILFPFNEENKGEIGKYIDWMMKNKVE